MLSRENSLGRTDVSASFDREADAACKSQPRRSGVLSLSKAKLAGHCHSSSSSKATFNVISL